MIDYFTHSTLTYIKRENYCDEINLFKDKKKDILSVNEVEVKKKRSTLL